MSVYSGKCDLYDGAEIHGDVNDFIKTHDIYIGDNIIPLRINTEKDLVPYYPYLTATAAWSDGHGVIHLTTRSFVDIEERERLEWYQKEVVRYLNRYKRKKIVPTLEDFIGVYGKLFTNEEALKKVYIRASNKDMSLSGIHLPMHDHYRKNLYEEMLRVGWDEIKARNWCFGYRTKEEYEKVLETEEN